MFRFTAGDVVGERDGHEAGREGCLGAGPATIIDVCLVHLQFATTLSSCVLRGCGPSTRQRLQRKDMPHPKD